MVRRGSCNIFGSNFRETDREPEISGLQKIPHEEAQSSETFSAAGASHESRDPADWFPVTSTTFEFWLQRNPEECWYESVANEYPASIRSYKPTKSNP